MYICTVYKLSHVISTDYLNCCEKSKAESHSRSIRVPSGSGYRMHPLVYRLQLQSNKLKWKQFAFISKSPFSHSVLQFAVLCR